MGASITVSGVASPLLSAAAAVTSLNVEPGAEVRSTARLVSGSRSLSSSLPYAVRIALGSCEDNDVGSYDGRLAIASTAPVVGSSATTAPTRPASPSYAACWAARSNVSTTEPPVILRPVM